MKIDSIKVIETKFKCQSIILLLCFCALLSIDSFSQIKSFDLQKLKSHKVDSLQFNERVVTFGVGDNKFVNYTFGSMMFVYQKYLSSQIAASCLYGPTCSAYGKQLFSRYGLIKGLFTTADRIMRCDRISATDIRRIEINKHDHKVHETVEFYSFSVKDSHNCCDK